MFCFVWETDSHYISLAGLKLTTVPWRLFSRAGIKGIYCYVLLAIAFNKVRKFSVSIKKLFSKSTHLWLISQFQCIPYLLYFLLIHHWNHNIYPDLLIIVFINTISINCYYMLSCLVIWQNIENFHFTEHFQYVVFYKHRATNIYSTSLF